MKSAERRGNRRLLRGLRQMGMVIAPNLPKAIKQLRTYDAVRRAILQDKRTAFSGGLLREARHRTDQQLSLLQGDKSSPYFAPHVTGCMRGLDYYNPAELAAAIALGMCIFRNGVGY